MSASSSEKHISSVIDPKSLLLLKAVMCLFVNGLKRLTLGVNDLKTVVPLKVEGCAFAVLSSYVFAVWQGFNTANGVKCKTHPLQRCLLSRCRVPGTDRARVKATDASLFY